MLKKTIAYTDFDGNQREEDFYFNLTEAELTKLEMSVGGGFRKWLQELVKKQNGPVIMDTFTDIIKQSYGVKSNDGRNFVKSEEAYNDFVSTEAYSKLFVELCTDADAASAFLMSVIPAKLKKAIEDGIPNDVTNLTTSANLASNA